VYGCGPLSRAIIRGDAKEVEYFISHHPACLDEVNALNQTPLHLATHSPIILELLLGTNKSKNWLTHYDSSACLPLDYAMALSGGTACDSDTPAETGCTCTLAVALLLDAGSIVIPSTIFAAMLTPPYRSSHLYARAEIPMQASLHCIIYVAAVLKKRREKLKMLALDFLPIIDIERLRLQDEPILDTHASEVHRLLDDHEVQIPDALGANWRLVVNNLGTKERELALRWRHVFPRKAAKDSSVFRYLMSASDADIFYRQGFRGLGSAGLNRHSSTFPPHPSFVLWFIEHVSHSHGKGPLMIYDVPLFMLHCMKDFEATVNGFDQEELDALKSIYSKLLTSDSAGEMICHCSCGASQPFTNMWGLFVGSRDYEDHILTRDQLELVYCPQRIARNAGSYLATLYTRCGIPVQPLDHLLRILTFVALGLTHTCRRPSYPIRRYFSEIFPDDCSTSSSDDCSTSSSDTNEAEESERIWMTESSVLKRLEDLWVLLYEESSKLWANDTMVHPQTIYHFLDNIWAPIVSEDIEKHRKREEQEREEHGRAGAELGVEWMSPGDGGSSDEKGARTWTLDEWLKKLEQI
jgi:hypothetical protein